MRELETNLLDWQKRYGTEEACAQALTQQRWPEGFRCPRCGHDHGYVILRVLQVSLPNLAYGGNTVSLHQSVAD